MKESLYTYVTEGDGSDGSERLTVAAPCAYSRSSGISTPFCTECRSIKTVGALSTQIEKDRPTERNTQRVTFLQAHNVNRARGSEIVRENERKRE